MKKLRASGVSFGRNIIILAITLVLAVLASVFAPNNAFAAEATWQGNDLEYNGQSFTEIPKDGLPANLLNGTRPYAWIDSSATPQKASIIFVKENVVGFSVDIRNSTEGTLQTFTHSPPSTFTSTSDPPINITISQNLEAGDNTRDQPSCAPGNLSWIVCPVVWGISGLVDMVYDMIRDYLEVTKLSMSTGKENGLYQIWSLVRTVANVMFVIVFLLIIYSQMTGDVMGAPGKDHAGFSLSNYAIKRMIPKLIIAVILVNISYIISALAIDISNMLGHSIRAIFDGVRDNYLVNMGNLNITWGDLSTYFLAGGATTGLVVGSVALSVATGAGGAAFGFLILGVLIPVAVSIMVAFIILFARQAIITILVLLAPLAFVAMVLPSSQQLYSKWQKSFMSLLVFFPMFALLFGGAQLAGSVILSTANGRPHIVLMGMAVQIVPLFVTPWMIKFSNGLLGEIANKLNSASSPIKQAGKSWAKDRQEHAKSQKMAKTNERWNDPNRKKPNWASRNLAPKNIAYRYDRAKKIRDAQKKHAEELLQQSADQLVHRQQAGEDIRDNPSAWYNRAASATRNKLRLEEPSEKHHRQHQLSERLKHQNQAYQSLSDSKSKLAWEQHLQDGDDPNASADSRKYRQMLTDTKLNEGLAKVYTDKMAGADSEMVEGFISSTAGLRQMVKQTAHHTNMAESYKKTIQEEAGKEWEQMSKTDDRIKAQRLAESAATDAHRNATAQWNEIVEDVRLKGSSSIHATSTDAATQSFMQSSANAIRDESKQALVNEKIVADLKSSHESIAETEYIGSARGQTSSRVAQSYKDQLAAAQAKETAIVQEWRTEEGAKGLTGDDAITAQILRDADITKKAYTRRNEMATDVSNQEYAELVKEDAVIPGGTETLAKVAGGIAGKTGISQAKAHAMQTVFSAAGKAVEAEKTLLSQIKEDVILSDSINGEKGLGSIDILDEPAERLAAMAGTIAKRQHMTSHILLWDRVGELRRIAEDELNAATDAGSRAIAEAKISKVKDMEQQLMQDKSKTPYGIGDRAQGDAVVGNYTGNIYEAARGRLGANNSFDDFMKMDPDDMRLVMELAAADKLTDEELKKVAEGYKGWRDHPTHGSSLRDKHRAFFEPILKLQEHGIRDFEKLQDASGNIDPNKFMFQKVLRMNKNGPRTDY